MEEESSGFRERRRLPQRCGQDNCPAKWGYILDGLLYCRNGHHQPNFQLVYNDEVERFGASQGETSRAERSERASGQTRALRESRVLHHQPGYYLYLLCYQHLLRLQCAFLVQEKGFPPNIEQCVKDLWALRASRVHELYGSKLKPGTDANEDSESEFDQASQTMFSSQPQESDSLRSQAYGKMRILPSPSDSLPLIYLAAMLLRIPLCLRDLFQWSFLDELPLHRMARNIPTEIRKNLTNRYQNLLEYILDKKVFKERINSTINLYQREFQLAIPPFNYRICLFRYIQKLALPLHLFRSAEYIARLADIDFSFVPRDGGRKLHGSGLPEAVVMAILIIAVKLHNPFSSAATFAARSEADFSLFTISWPEWLSSHHKNPATKTQGTPFTSKDLREINEEDVFSISVDEVDAYLDWYTDTFLDNPEEEVARRRSDYLKRSSDLLKMFPIRENAGHGVRPRTSLALSDKVEAPLADSTIQSVAERLRFVISSLTTSEILASPDEAFTQQSVRNGFRYEVYANPKYLIGVSWEFHQRAADAALLTIPELLSTVRRCEDLLEKSDINKST